MKLWWVFSCALFRKRNTRRAWVTVEGNSQAWSTDCVSTQTPGTGGERRTLLCDTVLGPASDDIFVCVFSLSDVLGNTQSPREKT